MPLNKRQTKNINKSLRYLENWWRQFNKQLERDIIFSEGYDDFLERTRAYTTNNILLDEMSEEIVKNVINATNFQKLKNRELVKETIRVSTSDLIMKVGEDLKNEIRTLVSKGYDLGLHSREIAPLVLERDLEALYIIPGEKTLTESEWNELTVEEQMNYTFNSNIRVMSPMVRSKTIARTEVARAQNIVNYTIAKEDEAIGFQVICRNDCCPYCAKAYHDLEDYKPTETKERLLTDGVTFSMEDTEMLPPFHPNSYHKDTFVFTDKGWKLICDINPDADKVLSLKPDGTKLEFLKPNCIIKHHENQIINMNNKSFDMSVTTDHDCFIHQRRDGGKNGKYFEPQFRKPDELNSESRFLRTIDIDRTQPDFIDVNGLKFQPEDYAFFMAWYISEGSVLHNPETAKKKGFPVKISQQIQENRTILEKELKRICDYLGLKLRIGKTYFEIPSKALHDYLVPLGYSNEKYIPSEVFKLNKKSLNIFLDNYVRGDGHIKKNSSKLVPYSESRMVFTSSTKLRDGLSYLILLCGYCPSIKLFTKKGNEVKHKNGTYTQNYDVWKISITKRKYTQYRYVNVSIDENYNDYTYCVVLPKYHTLWTMRNGKTSYGGNCRCSAIFY